MSDLFYLLFFCEEENEGKKHNDDKSCVKW